MILACHNSAGGSAIIMGPPKKPQYDSGKAHWTLEARQAALYRDGKKRNASFVKQQLPGFACCC